MNLVRRVVEILVERFVASIGSLFAARIETVAALMHAEEQDELEERARRLEEEDKAHLAADLRSRASQLASATPGASGHEVFRQLQHEHAEFETPRIAQGTSEKDEEGADEQTPEPTTRRRTKRRCARRTKTD